jgi:hypothetical protein
MPRQAIVPHSRRDFNVRSLRSEAPHRRAPHRHVSSRVAFGEEDEEEDQIEAE